MMSPRAGFNFAWTIGYTGAISSYVIASQTVRRDRARFARDSRRWARGVARGIGLDVRAFGTWRLDPSGVYVIMANHQSHVDIPALFNALPMVPGFLAKAELRRVPVFGRAMEVGGHVFVERGKRERAVAAMEQAADQMRAGSVSIVIFPEGTRSRRREVMPFKKGGFHLARHARVPIVPVGLRGTADILPKHSKTLIGGTCEVHVGEPIDPADHPEMEDLIATVRARICELADLPAAPDRSGAAAQ